MSKANAVRPAMTGVEFVAQAWDGERKHAEVEGLSYDAAREVASAFAIAGMVGRAMSQTDGVDWCEVYSPGGNMRSGTFAETTLVHEFAQVSK